MLTKLDGEKAMPRLSNEHKDLLFEYYELANHLELSDSDSERIIKIWESATKDEALLLALEIIDNFLVITMQEENSLADDDDARAFISEYLNELVAEKKQAHNFVHHSETHSEEIARAVFLCPDGSGFVALTNEIEARPLGEQSCPKCKKSISEHVLLPIRGEDRVGLD